MTWPLPPRATRFAGEPLSKVRNVIVGGSFVAQLPVLLGHTGLKGPQGGGNIEKTGSTARLWVAQRWL